MEGGGYRQRNCQGRENEKEERDMVEIQRCLGERQGEGIKREGGDINRETLRGETE